MAAKNEKRKTKNQYNPYVVGYYDKAVLVMLDANCAIIYHHLKSWCDYNKAHRQNLRDGRYWTFNSMRAWSELLPGFTEKQIRFSLEKLEKAGLIVTGSFNKQPYDRTKWYSVNPVPYEEYLPDLWDFDLPNLANGEAKIGEPIPMINTNSNTMIKDDEEEERNENFNSSIQKQNQETAKVFKSYESEIGVLTSLIGNEIKAFLEQDNVSPDWIIAAIEEASRNNKRSWSYISAIIKRWQVEGFQSSNKPESKSSGKPQAKSKAKPQTAGRYVPEHEESQTIVKGGTTYFIEGKNRLAGDDVELQF